MYRFCLILGISFLSAFCSVTYAQQDNISRWQWGGDEVYDQGFMHMLKKDGNGAKLWDMELIENDSPGAGRSEKGVSNDTIWGDIRGRKILHLDDPRAEKAWFVIVSIRQGAHPLRFSVNGNESVVENWDRRKAGEAYRWVEFPASWLRKGANVIDFWSPEAKSENEGWGLILARADEFEAGGGDPSQVGETTFKSFDNGRRWSKSPFGPERNERAEYVVRISLDRHVQTGWLATPVIDLWRRSSDGLIIPQREVRRVNIDISSEIPQATSVEWFIRAGSDPSPKSDKWGEWVSIGNTPEINYVTSGPVLNRRFVQLRAELSTSNPLLSPVVRNVSITSELNQRSPFHPNIVPVKVVNDPIKYSSIDWQWEKWDRPEFKILKDRENLDEMFLGSRTQFDKQVKILDHVTKRWRWGIIGHNFPAYDALSILERTDNHGWGGMCLIFNKLIGGMCQAYGWQARFINVIAHEVIEVWNDDYGKWVTLDAAFNSNEINTYQYCPVTAEPLNMLEMHERFMDYYYGDRAIDWMNEVISPADSIKDGKELPVKRGTLSPDHPSRHTSFMTAGSMRMIPRNNWYESPTPRPLNHGSTWWPWNGYVNWHDERTPPRRQYSWFTDRKNDLWPDLNKVRVHATSGHGSDRLFLQFETYTPNFSHFEVDIDETGWREVPQHWVWLLGSGRNQLRVRAVNMQGVNGKHSVIVVNHGNTASFGE